jgi:2-polyprenyl-3-methyl-5-hydroxy-6-metoxy-1,4-benzoquinol methylase
VANELARNIDPQRLYDLQAAASPRAGENGGPSRRDEQIAGWAQAFFVSREREVHDVVELAIGDAGLSFALCRRFPEARILGVDIAPGRIESARAACKAAGVEERMRFEIADVERGHEALGAASADALFAIDVLEHVFDVFGFMAQAARIVRPGGLAVIRVPNVAYIRHRIALAFGELPITASWFGPPHDLGAWRSTWGWDGGHLHYFTCETLAALLGDSGFRVVEWHDPGTRFESLRRRVPSLLVGNLCVLAERR